MDDTLMAMQMDKTYIVGTEAKQAELAFVVEWHLKKPSNTFQARLRTWWREYQYLLKIFMQAKGAPNLSIHPLKFLNH